MAQENTEEMYIGGLMQASLKEVMRDTHRPSRKSGELLLPPVRGMHERAFEGEGVFVQPNESCTPVSCSYRIEEDFQLDARVKALLQRLTDACDVAPGPNAGEKNRLVHSHGAIIKFPEVR